MVATSVFPSPVFISAMSPSWSTIAPMSWTSNGRSPRARFPGARTGRNRLEDELVELLAVLEPLLELGGLPLELLVRKRLEAGLERGDVVRLFGELLEAPALADPQEFLECSVVLGHQLSRVPNA